MNTRNIQSFMEYIQSAPSAQQYLVHCYRNLLSIDPEQQSFLNAYRFIYFLQHGSTYYAQGKIAPLAVKPMLLFYGMGHLLKALLLTKRPHYPENTSVLAHGVSTRKRKKQNYSFLEDEVKVQYKGFFPYFADHMFHVKQFMQEKYTMANLFKRIPELQPLYQAAKQQQHIFYLGPLNSNHWSISERILNDYNWTFPYFTKCMKAACPEVDAITLSKKNIVCSLAKCVKNPNHSYFYYDRLKKQLTISRYRTHFEPFPELLVHYLLLYNLSMICRYETEWWGDQLHSFSSDDIVYIKSFLTITEEKVPLLVGAALESAWHHEN
ncbi:YaaC family protein [Pontibacillus litoralis]|uniref:YaaC n=1 Tax=Pontibacillus litoralis JSM 072002 TaxID=1385512 RepID=A0A0A5G3L2_9BACI|nr:YaaC family protein [Pontibacillus litoralis]KGX85670.1 hypothetical protein N784_08385 [Pontibacillus litoralis JSM 072002]